MKEYDINPDKELYETPEERVRADIARMKQEAGSEPDDLSPAILITLLRLYDVLMTQLQRSDPESAERIWAVHSEGKILSPEPSFRPDKEE